MWLWYHNKHNMWQQQVIIGFLLCLMIGFLMSTCSAERGPEAQWCCQWHRTRVHSQNTQFHSSVLVRKARASENIVMFFLQNLPHYNSTIDQFILSFIKYTLSDRAESCCFCLMLLLLPYRKLWVMTVKSWPSMLVFYMNTCWLVFLIKAELNRSHDPLV